MPGPLSPPAASHVIVLPVKPPARGKSRLVGLPDQTRVGLARAFALDTAEACLATTAVAQVLVVTDDAFFASDVAALGCAVIPDGVSGDLNGTLVQAAAEARRRWPALRPAALCGDLPALRPLDLAAALGSPAAGAADAYDAATTESDLPGQTRGRAAFVVDAVGSGTTLYTASYAAFAPRFGPDSARLHRADGATPITGELSSLRHDVDTLDDLRAVLSLGLGPRTRLAALQAGILS